MNDDAGRVYAMLDDVKRRGENYGLMVRGVNLVICGPGSPTTEVPTAYDKTLLKIAIESGLVEKRRFSGDWEYWCPSKFNSPDETPVFAARSSLPRCAASVQQKCNKTSVL